MNQIVKVDFCVTEFSATEIMTWECHAYEQTEVSYDIILDRYLLMDMVLYLKSF